MILACFRKIEHPIYVFFVIHEPQVVLKYSPYIKKSQFKYIMFQKIKFRFIKIGKVSEITETDISITLFNYELHVKTEQIIEYAMFYLILEI